jgi:hypothetical protein
MEIIMSIKTLKSKDRVVGLSINGKNFMLDKQICHALMMEEKRIQDQIFQTKKEISDFKDELDSKFYIGESELLNVALKFQENGEIEVSSAQVEFKTIELLENRNTQEVILLESFLNAINCSIRKQRSELDNKFRKIYQKVG